MSVIHFTHGATDPVTAVDSRAVHFVPLADGSGDLHLGCAHLEPGAVIHSPSLPHAVTLLAVHGRVTVIKEYGGRAWLSGGVGVVLPKGERYTLTSETGAILLILEADELTAHPRGISSPDRIAGQTWPSDPKPEANDGAR